MSVPEDQNPLGILWERGMWKDGGVLKGRLINLYGDTTLTGVDPNADASALTNGTYMFYGCTGLSSWTMDLPNLTNGTYMF